MRPIVLLGHRHICPIHGTGFVITGTSGVTLDRRPVARIGDAISCGAVIVTGSNATIDGAGVARKGDTTSHGGTLIEGDEGWLLE